MATSCAPSHDCWPRGGSTSRARRATGCPTPPTRLRPWSAGVPAERSRSCSRAPDGARAHPRERSIRTAMTRSNPSRRPTLSRGVSFAVAAAIALLAFAANSSASPLYRVYQGEFRFSATTLTLLFTVYIVVLLVTLLVLGSTSDYIGRRPVMLRLRTSARNRIFGLLT